MRRRSYHNLLRVVAFALLTFLATFSYAVEFDAVVQSFDAANRNITVKHLKSQEVMFGLFVSPGMVTKISYPENVSIPEKLEKGDVVRFKSDEKGYILQSISLIPPK